MKILFLLLLLTSSVFTQVRNDSIRLYGDGLRDDTAALQAWNDGVPVWDKNFKKVYGNVIQNQTFLITGSLRLNDRTKTLRFNTFITKYPYRYPMNFNSFWQIRHYSNYYYIEDRYGMYRRVKFDWFS